MGSCLSQEPEVDFESPVDFNHFHILRAIGKGAFGKVCIVKKRDTKQMYAMKYMNKVQIIKKHAVENVFREIELLRILDHPFQVNLWFTFQDREDIFMVLDLMLGGDLNYHLEKEGRFQIPRVRLYMAEIALALEYLREKSIIHRDVKPANMLLDSSGHVHLTDFNVACTVHPEVSITSITGTKPYMAPEVFHPSSRGYSYAVDWWSLGISAYEMLRGQRPFPVERNMSNDELYSQLRHSRPSASARWDQSTCDILKMLLHPDEDKRLQLLDTAMAHPFFQMLDWEEVKTKEVTPTFVPPQNRINCDPTHELEEMIVEPNPLHKKQSRLSKRHYKHEDEKTMEELDRISNRFIPYNRQNNNIRESAAESQGLTSPPRLSEIREVDEGAEGEHGEEVGGVSSKQKVKAELGVVALEETPGKGNREENGGCVGEGVRQGEGEGERGEVKEERVTEKEAATEEVMKVETEEPEGERVREKAVTTEAEEEVEESLGPQGAERETSAGDQLTADGCEQTETSSEAERRLTEPSSTGEPPPSLRQEVSSSDVTQEQSEEGRSGEGGSENVSGRKVQQQTTGDTQGHDSSTVAAPSSTAPIPNDVVVLPS